MGPLTTEQIQALLAENGNRIEKTLARLQELSRLDRAARSFDEEHPQYEPHWDEMDDVYWFPDDLDEFVPDPGVDCPGWTP